MHATISCFLSVVLMDLLLSHNENTTQMQGVLAVGQ